VAGKIFISYRHDDSAAYAIGIGQYLTREFGSRDVFMDIYMGAGETFADVLEQRLAQCKVMLAVIGPGWLDRLDDPGDWVRFEIVRALARNIRVIPVTVGGTTLPKRGELPEELRPLLDRLAVAITTSRFRNDMGGLVKDIRAIPGPPSWWPRIGAGFAAAIVALAAVVGAYYLSQDQHTLRGPPNDGGLSR
jgi:hypothetical protein